MVKEIELAYNHRRGMSVFWMRAFVAELSEKETTESPLNPSV